MARGQQAWTAGQIQILRRYGSQGVDKCVQMLRVRYGINRTRACVQMKASRLGISLCARETCPGCGRTVRKLRQSGFCDLCHERAFLTPRKEMARVMREAEYTKEEKDAIRDARRERDRNRKRKETDARKIRENS